MKASASLRKSFDPIARLAGLLATGVIMLSLAACGTGINPGGTVDAKSAGAGAAASTGADASGVNSGSAAGRTYTEAEKAALLAAAAKAARVIYFEFDSFVILPEFQGALEANASALKAMPDKKLVIEGHTDERGGREYNIALGQKRAEAVRRALSVLGVNEPQLESVSFGKEKPALEGSNEEAWAKNRRAELNLK